jgi:hypothetical protein
MPISLEALDPTAEQGSFNIVTRMATYRVICDKHPGGQVRLRGGIYPKNVRALISDAFTVKTAREPGVRLGHEMRIQSDAGNTTTDKVIGIFLAIMR